MSGPRKRRLAAIMVLDVVAYSTMMAEDEDGTLSRVLTEQDNVIEPAIDDKGGRVVKRMGDGILAEFPSVTAAVESAQKIQKIITDLELRIGINLGEVIDEDGDIFGDGVNVAARIEALAQPGGIILSEAAKAQVKRDDGLQFEDLGRHPLKNIPVPVHIYRVSREHTGKKYGQRRSLSLPFRRLSLSTFSVILVVLVAVITLRPTIRLTSDPLDSFDFDRPSIAVLPFEPLQTSPEQAFWGDGLTANLTTDLARVKGLIVVSPPGGSIRFWDADNRSAAVQSAASHLVSGTIQKYGNQVRINAMLTDARSNRQLWAARFDRELGDFFALQDEIAAEIIRSLEVTLSSEEQQRLYFEARSKRHREFELAFAALDRMETRSISGMVSHDLPPFRSALADYPVEELLMLLDQRRRFAGSATGSTTSAELLSNPSFLTATVSAIQADSMLFSGPATATPARVARLGNLAKQVSNDTEDPEELSVALALAALFSGDHTTALSHAREAVRKSPSYANGYTLLAWVLMAKGQEADAQRALEILERLAPAPSAWQFTVAAEVHLLGGRTEEAIEAASAALYSDRHFGRARLIRAAALGLQGQASEARNDLDALAHADIEWVRSNQSNWPPYANEKLAEPFLSGLAAAQSDG